MEDFYPAIIVLIILTYFTLCVGLSYSYDIVQQDVENIVFQYTQIAAKKGIMYQSVYDEMISRLDKYGSFTPYIKAEKFSDGSIYTLEGKQVLDIDLREEGYDLLTITVVYDKKHPVNLVYSLNFFMLPNGKDYDIRLFGKACVALF
ncbi:MAG: hypothetical protein ACM3TR_01760 [Caulobacteraceae bacterium]